MKNWIPIGSHTHYSLLMGLSKPIKLAQRCKELGYESCALADQGNISGAVAFIKAMEKFDIKPIVGSEFFICKNDPSIKDVKNKNLTNILILAKNFDGWKSLISSTSYANKPEFFYYKPRINIQSFEKFAGNLIAISGQPGTEIANSIFLDFEKAIFANTYEQAVSLVHPEWKSILIKLIGEHQEIFGKENFFLGVQLMDYKNSPYFQVIYKAIKYMAKKLGIKTVSLDSSYYPERSDASDQRLLLASSYETTLENAVDKIKKCGDNKLLAFFKSNNFYMPSFEEVEKLYDTDDIKNTLLIKEMCEKYKITREPTLPKFPKCPDNMSSSEYLRKLSYEGWSKISHKTDPARRNEYLERIEKELKVFSEYELLSNYFLIVQDYCNYARSQGLLMSPGRGSGAGCMISAALGITDIVVDPLVYNLLMERFYNSGRNSPGRISLPDIDCDFPIKSRDSIKKYIRNLYGKDRVTEMVTFSRMQGKGAIKDVMRAHQACSFSEVNEINKHIPDEADISDQLQLMKEETGEASIIKWALENHAEELSKWCVLKEDGTLEGQYAKLVAQAIRLEGTKKSQSKHPAGLIISTDILSEVCPMVYDKSSGALVAGLEMDDLESMGHVKFDILGVATLDKIMTVSQLLQKGE